MLVASITVPVWETDPSLLPVVVATIVTIVACVLLHYAAIWALAHRLVRRNVPTMIMIPSVVLGLMVMHFIEIGVFGLAYQIIEGTAGANAGILKGNYDSTMRDMFYFSSTVYTTVGFGDIYPEGSLRLLVGCEALTGLVLITWSASFTFLVMQSRWRALTGHLVDQHHDGHAEHRR